MRFTYYSNFMTHHELPICLELYKKLGEDFCFVASKSIEVEKKELGYKDMNKQYPFILRAYEDEESYNKSIELAKTSDVIIFGTGEQKILDIRMQENLLTFRYAERLFKKGIYRRYIPSTRKKIKEGYVRYKNKNFYMLCSSAYTSYDLYLCGFDANKCIKWGYFSEVKQHNIQELIEKKEDEKVKILWAGRLIGWKRTKDAIKAAKKLKSDGYVFELQVIGIGKDEDKLKKMVRKSQQEDYIKFLGAMPPDEVRRYMEKANIYLFTSNFNEGWGVVLNEAMSSGCATIASHAIGSVPYLLKDNINGLVYKSKRHKEIYNKLKYLIDNKDKQNRYGENALHTMQKTWNAEVAVQRILKLSEQLLQDNTFNFYEEGPCSKAEIIDNNWYK